MSTLLIKAWKVSRQSKGYGDSFSKVDNTAVEHLLKMEPKVECTGDSMKLQVQEAVSTPGSLFFVDRGMFFIIWSHASQLLPYTYYLKYAQITLMLILNYVLFIF